ncbi:SOCS box domain-containing protein [Trichonephila clavipes]|nr:SOCS box domain-containing protein [Trichonephila clavipes]
MANEDMLNVKIAIQKSNHKIRALMNFLKFFSIPEETLHQIFIPFLELLAEEREDSELICQFLQLQPQLVGELFSAADNPRLVDFVLYHTTHAKRRLTKSEIEKLQDFSNVDESNIRLWRRNKTNFENCDRRKRTDRRGKPHWPELEAEIHKWILKERDDGKAVSTVSIRMKARVIAREMNIVNFSGGPTWCYRFMKRNNLVVQRSDRNYLMTGKNNLTTF